MSAEEQCVVVVAVFVAAFCPIAAEGEFLLTIEGPIKKMGKPRGIYASSIEENNLFLLNASGPRPKA